MPKHKSKDYKLSAVQYYLENNVKTCEIFKREQKNKRSAKWRKLSK